MTQAYVYNGKEVFLTGRTASKSTRSGAARVLYEVKPIKYLNSEEKMPGVEDWVRLTDLYGINIETEETDNDN